MTVSAHGAAIDHSADFKGVLLLLHFNHERVLFESLSQAHLLVVYVREELSFSPYNCGSGSKCILVVFVINFRTLLFYTAKSSPRKMHHHHHHHHHRVRRDGGQGHHRFPHTPSGEVTMHPSRCVSGFAWLFVCTYITLHSYSCKHITSS